MALLGSHRMRGPAPRMARAGSPHPAEWNQEASASALAAQMKSFSLNPPTSWVE